MYIKTFREWNYDWSENPGVPRCKKQLILNEYGKFYSSEYFCKVPHSPMQTNGMHPFFLENSLAYLNKGLPSGANSNSLYPVQGSAIPSKFQLLGSFPLTLATNEYIMGDGDHDLPTSVLSGNPVFRFLALFLILIVHPWRWREHLGNRADPEKWNPSHPQPHSHVCPKVSPDSLQDIEFPASLSSAVNQPHIVWQINTFCCFISIFVRQNYHLTALYTQLQIYFPTVHTAAILCYFNHLA